MSNNILNVENISKSFKDTIALDKISFSASEGEIFGFLGPSGSGKTTTINILTQQIQADSGEAYLFDTAINKLTPADFKDIGIMSDTSGFYEKLSLYENLSLYANILESDFSYLDYLLKKLDLFEHKNKKAEKLSTGMKKRMLLIRALVNKPKLVFLDEPTSSLDPNTTKKVHALLNDIKEAGTTIFLTTHDMDEAEKICDQLVLLNNGKIVAEGKPADIKFEHTDNKSIEPTFNNKSSKIIPFDQLATFYAADDIYAIHSCEPSLEQIFINLTGEELYE